MRRPNAEQESPCGRGSEKDHCRNEHPQRSRDPASHLGPARMSPCQSQSDDEQRYQHERARRNLGEIRNGLVDARPHKPRDVVRSPLKRDASGVVDLRTTTTARRSGRAGPCEAQPPANRDAATRPRPMARSWRRPAPSTSGPPIPPASRPSRASRQCPSWSISIRCNNPNRSAPLNAYLEATKDVALARTEEREQARGGGGDPRADARAPDDDAQHHRSREMHDDGEHEVGDVRPQSEDVEHHPVRRVSARLSSARCGTARGHRRRRRPASPRKSHSSR